MACVDFGTKGIPAFGVGTEEVIFLVNLVGHDDLILAI